MEPGGVGPDGGKSGPRLAGALLRAVQAAAGGVDRLTVLYSGGVDSSIIAHLARRFAAVTLLVVGTEGARDRAAARAGAQGLGLPLTEALVTEEQVRDVAAIFADELGGLREPYYSVALGTAVLVGQAPDRRVLWGQGADELFYGYARYRTMVPGVVRQSASADLLRVEREDGPRADRIAARLGRELRAPFLDAAVLTAVRDDPPPLPTPTVSKPGLRRLARDLGLPGSICERPKRAFQYGSGVHRAVHRPRRDLVASDPRAGLAAEGASERRDIGDHDPPSPGGQEP